MLTPGKPLSSCQACVIIPVRNEQATLGAALTRLASQKDLSGSPVPFGNYEVLLLLNNCTDRSVAVAKEFQAGLPEFQLHLIVRDFAPSVAHAGTARRALMDEAYRRLMAIRRPGGLILSTDADSEVAPDWLAQNLSAVRQGVEAVGGLIEIKPADRRLLDPLALEAYSRDKRYRGLVAKLEALLDPLPWDPWPRHDQHFGASLSCTAAAYERAGGMPAARCLEDMAFYDALVRVDTRFRHSPDVRVTTAARLNGRAQIGFAWQLREWQRQGKKHLPQLVDTAEFHEEYFRVRAQLRKLHQNGPRRRDTEIDSAAAALGITSTDLVRSYDSDLPFGQWLEDLRFRKRFAKRWPGETRRDIRAVLPELRRLVTKISEPVETVPAAAARRSLTIAASILTVTPRGSGAGAG